MMENAQSELVNNNETSAARIIGSGGRNNGLGSDSGLLRPQSSAGVTGTVNLSPETIAKYTPLLF